MEPVLALRPAGLALPDVRHPAALSSALLLLCLLPLCPALALTLAFAQ